MATNNNAVVGQGLQSSSNPLKDERCHTKDIHVENEVSIKHSEKLKDVRNLVKNVQNDPFKALEMVDALQKLCIDYHFQEEIDSILKMLYARISVAHVYEHDLSLYEISHSFRILRQEGYYVSADVFGNFKQNEGKFKVEIGQDVKGLMAFYEASQLRIEGESILEEAKDFSSHCLQEMMTNLDNDEAVRVKNTLKHSYPRTSSTFMVKNFIKYYSGTTMSELAKLELDKIQLMHRREVHQISRWWMDLGLAEELKLARNQPWKWYLWPMASLTDPSLSEQRLELTKPVALVYLIDDIFDVYGTLNELILFTEAVKRWDTNSVEQLPQHLRICFEALHDITYEISDKIFKKHGFNPIKYLKKVWKNLCEAFLVEAKWFDSEYPPMAEEYLKNGIISSGTQVVVVHMFFLLGGGTSKESARVIMNNQGIITCMAKILRLWDDLGSAKDEHQDGRDGSYVTYYMKENKGCSLENAQAHVNEMISNTWKHLTKECLSPNPFSATFTKVCLNLARMIPMMYDYDENHSLPFLGDYINAMF